MRSSVVPVVVLVTLAFSILYLELFLASSSCQSMFCHLAIKSSLAGCHHRAGHFMDTQILLNIFVSHLRHYKYSAYGCTKTLSAPFSIPGISSIQHTNVPEHGQRHYLFSALQCSAFHLGKSFTYQGLRIQFFGFDIWTIEYDLATLLGELYLSRLVHLIPVYTV